MKKIVNVVYWLVLIVIVAAAAAVVLAKFNTPLGVRVFSVQSGSMEPAIHVGSIVFVKTGSYDVGDVITARSERNANETVTHRIVEVTDEAGTRMFKLKGDANEDPDGELVPERRVIGKVILSLPYFGRVVAFAQTQVGFVVMIVIPGTIIVYSELMNIKKEMGKMFSGKKKLEKEEEEDDEQE